MDFIVQLFGFEDTHSTICGNNSIINHHAEQCRCKELEKKFKGLEELHADVTASIQDYMAGFLEEEGAFVFEF